ncbi:branched-chain-amino-acid aminotransferase 1 [Ophiostoma piceae UAMH 11346]|uniref:Branched-chain-amino-acid aminotransferase 1 n=1 Tax=Ophiostoma piceae (strain UAMH 11346) TaxID=1262450 RepID=S3CK67_OPHP1|nr:branched-chain-amino-acid aminotransferase 1 [Ophiostoma piceae UAMH 11346]
MAAFPPPPVDSIDWSNVGFRVREVNGHVESHYTKATGQWSQPVFVADPYLRMHGMAPALNYGQQAYEGLKAFRTPGDKGIQVFRADRNAVRLQHSASVISVPPVPTEIFEAAVHAAVARNAEFVPPHATGAAMYIRPQVFGSSAQLGLSPPEDYLFCVYVLPTGVYHGTNPVKALILEDFDRAAPNGTGSAKVGGNYAPVLRHSEQAYKTGYGITLHLDSARHEEIDEFSTSGFLGVKKGASENDITVVHPDSKSVIESVTSASVQELARSFGWKVEQRAIKYDELPTFSEVFAAGTAAALVPIKSITRTLPAGHAQSLRKSLASLPSNVTFSGENETITFMPESQTEAGPIAQRLLTQLKGIQLGKIEDTFGWCSAVTAEDIGKAVDEAKA